MAFFTGRGELMEEGLGDLNPLLNFQTPCILHLEGLIMDPQFVSDHK